MTDWKVGDKVIVTGKYVVAGTTTITKVGRKYFYVANDSRDTPYQISTGHAKNDGYGSNSRCRTPEQYEADTVRDGVLDKLRKHGVAWASGWSDWTFRAEKFSTARLFELLNLLDQIAEENTITNLDKD
jgi:hypothetical protein